jgi:hypothetical protein
MGHLHGPEEIESEISRNLFSILLGQTAPYIGDAVDNMSERRRANIARICTLALKRLGNRVSDPGEVPPRVIGCLLSDGSYCQDRLASEYWAGLVACSRTANPADDRVVRRLKLLSRLSLHQIRTHYLFYATLRRLLMPTRDPAKVDFESKRYRMATFIPAWSYLQAMAFTENETKKMSVLASDALVGLGVDLLLDGSNTGTEEYLKRFFKTDAIRGEGLVLAPSLMGLQLFLWAFGALDRDAVHYLNATFDCAVEGIPEYCAEAALVYGDEYNSV